MSVCTIDDVRAAEGLIRPCPFCGEPFEILVGDSAGNIHDEDYLEYDDPYSDVSFGVSHSSGTCPLATIDGETAGNFWYPTLDELVEDFNQRCGLVGEAE